MLKAIHPVVLVTAGFFLILLLQCVSPVQLGIGASLAILAALIWARADWLRVVRRLRFIFLALLVLYAWQTPGTLMAPALAGFSPTWDGLRAVLEPGWRLLAVASVVALLLRGLSTEDWVSSLYVLALPFRICGLSPERFAVRLRLVLDYVGRRDLDWRHCLEAASDDLSAMPAEAWSIRLPAWHDWLVLLAVLVVLAMGGMW